jgi:hypothetical protein
MSPDGVVPLATTGASNSTATRVQRSALTLANLELARLVLADIG